MIATDDLAIPAALMRTGRASKPRTRRWKRIPRRPRPEGEVWAKAARWEVFITEDVPKLAAGLRLVWVIEGRKWARLHDGEAQARILMKIWLQLKQHGRAVKP